MKIRSAALSALALAGFAAPAIAQDSSYTPGTVWEFSDIKVAPGQFENYIDWLGGRWRQIQEIGKKEGAVVSYHVFSVNDPRKDEPDVILAIEYKDYGSNAQQLALQKKVQAALAMDPHTMESASGQREKLRTVIGAMQLQELKLK